MKTNVALTVLVLGLAAEVTAETITNPPDPSVRFGVRSTNGVELVLTTRTPSTKVGEPIRVSLVLNYTGKTNSTFDTQAIGVHDLFRVTDSQGTNVAWIGGAAQTVAHRRPIGQGESVELLKDFDLTESYLFAAGDRYQIYFRGEDHSFGQLALPESNRVNVEVVEGELPSVDKLVVAILAARPKDWFLGKSARATTEVTPAGRQTTRGCFAYLGRRAFQGEFLQIWQTTEPVDPLETGDKKLSQCLGKSASGYVYVGLGSKVLETWPTVIADLTAALHLENP